MKNAVARLDFPVASTADFAQLRGRFAELPMQPKVLGTREDGIDLSPPGRQSLSLLVGEETAGALCASEAYLGPGFGAQPHHQPTEEELWYLLEGSLDVRVGAQSAAIKAGSFAFIPRDTTHTFRNNGNDLARLLAWNAPAGHERAFEAMRAKAEQGITAFPELRETFRVHEIVLHGEEKITARNDAKGGKLLLERTQGRDASQPGIDIRVLLDGEESGGLFEVCDVVLERELSMRSAAAETCVYVVRGRAALAIDDVAQEVGGGAFAFVPRRRRLRIAPDPRAQIVLWTTPAASGGKR